MKPTVKKEPKVSGKQKRSHISWKTTDDYEIELRRRRMKEEQMNVTPITPGRNPFKDYLISRMDGDYCIEYSVELRSLTENINTCTCPDFHKNFLGTCKHIEKVKAQLSGKKMVVSPYVEIFMDRSPWRPLVRIPEKSAVTGFMHRYLAVNGEFKAPEVDTLQVLLRDLELADDMVRTGIRISTEVRKYVCRQLEKKQAAQWREEYRRQFNESNGQAPFLRHALYDYQIEGMLHLAFSGRALLADEMGLGKTVQAIAAAALLKECFAVKRVLVVTPASLKSEWEEQIRKFTALPAETVYGPRKQRLEKYRSSQAFFLLVNYEQVMIDYEDINRDFLPELVILDEAQRIKNWKTKTADRLKRLQLRFAFVLTGTPIENKIDELYSLVEFVEPSLFGSLFRFNRRFYDFDDDGKVRGLKNLRELHELVKPVMLRRRKDEISEQLPERIDNNYFVPMTTEQGKRYADYESIVVRLATMAQRRPLTPEEFDRLQLALSCMRMLCDSVYILDQKITESPKADEFMRILDDLWEDDPGRKIIVFSEWVRMLDLIVIELEKRGIAFALHTGKVNQIKRRKEINRFKDDTGCCLFLSSDSGSVGLNLQVASVVVNLDLPWNPAKLEQRIARAWRKHQNNTVNVINLIAENTIEHRMLATLDFKKGLSDAVLDARGEFTDFEKPNAKNAFMERLGTIMASKVMIPPDKMPVAKLVDVPPVDQLAQEVRLDPAGLNLCQVGYDKETGRVKSVFAVGSASAADKLKQHVEKTHGQILTPEQMLMISTENYALLQQLEKLGIITINTKDMAKVFESESTAPPRRSDRECRLALSKPVLTGAERQLKMALVLHVGGFVAESAAPARQAVLTAAIALYIHTVTEVPEKAPAHFTIDMFKAVSNAASIERKHLLLLQLCLHENQESDIATDDAVGFITAVTDGAAEFVVSATEFINRQSIT
jgi:superfamily II DNA or RNA helicase